MNYSTVYVGMDVHKETFSLCCFTNENTGLPLPKTIYILATTGVRLSILPYCKYAQLF